ncbi:hypothetical protein [Actinomadura sp. WMMA1423]|uniref:hypothetical protein n=1 Tax=Actinomadura sp. WMMA1423 TaxID=2591108 RepID=UPI0011472BBE|nr:hypothetical protein [Actinomadura sp. WMMA1423]
MTSTSEDQTVPGEAEGLVIGLDLGDGETTLAWTVEGTAADIRIHQRRTTGERGVLTAMARAATDRRRLLGEEAVYAAGAAEFSLNLKDAPDPAGVETPEAVLFVQSLLAEFLSERETSAVEPTMVVGHPAGWSTEVVDAYARHLRMQGIRTRLLPESQAALIHVRRPRGADGTTEVDSREKDRVLIVDIGSSTTDFTLIADLVPRSLPLGADFGCRRIDFQVAKLVTDNLGDDEVLRAALAEDGGKEFLLLACRRAKEAQFTGTQATILDQRITPRFRPIVDLAWTWLRSLEIPALVSTPGGWADELRNLLTQARELVGEEGPDLVVLTGGGSRMPFTRSMCAEIFPAAVIENDPEPAFSVARGLALAGYTELRLQRFRKALADLLDEPRLAELCEEHIEEGFEQLKRRLERKVRNAQVSATGSAEQRARDLVEGEDEPHAIEELRKALNQRLSERINSICRDYGVPSDALDLNFQLPLGFSESLTERLKGHVESRKVFASGRTSWMLSQQGRMIESLNRPPRGLQQPKPGGHPAWELAKGAWRFGGPLILEAADRATVRRMVKEIEALKLDEKEVHDLVEKIRAHVRDQLLGRLTEIENLIF